MARVQVLPTPGCAGCDALKRMLGKVLAEFPGLDWEEIDLIEHPEVAERYTVMSVPAVVIDGRLEFPSIPKEEALREKITAIVEGR
jgi:thioredoxin-like negative regulator of GroEL